MIKVEAPSLPSMQSPVRNQTERDDGMLAQAKEFEAVFISQMLKHSGFEKALSSNSGFGGENFASLLLQQYAAKIVENGGFGLTEHIYQQLADKEGENGNNTDI